MYPDIAFIWTKFVPLDWDLGCFNRDPGTPGRPCLHINSTAKITVNYLQAEIPVHWDVPVHQDPINRPLIALEVTPQSASYASLFGLYNLVQKKKPRIPKKNRIIFKKNAFFKWMNESKKLYNSAIVFSNYKGTAWGLKILTRALVESDNPGVKWVRNNHI